MIVAAIDVGTNTVRMLVRREHEEIDRILEITRLGKGVDASRLLLPESIARTVETIDRFVSRARSARADKIVIAATSAVRDSGNRSSFIEAVREKTGIEPRVLDGSQEASLSFLGASESFDRSILKVVIDIGGGSTELVAGTHDVAASTSTDAGSVRLTERHIRHDPASEQDLAAVRADARALLRSGTSRIAHALGVEPFVIGVAGTFTTLAGYSLGLDQYQRERTHRHVLTASDIRRAREKLAGMTIAERGRVAVITPGRADVIVTGAIIAEEALSALGADQVTISETDILDGLAATL